MARYLIAAIEQGLWSVLNLGVNLLLIRLAPPTEYGAFAFWANCGFVLSSIQNALTVCHLQVLAPGDGRDEPRLTVERTMHLVTLAFLLVVGVSALGGAALMRRGGSALGAPAAALFLPAFLLQQYVRALAFTRGRPATAAIQTGAVLATAVALLILAMLDHGFTAERILLSLGTAYALVGVVGAAQATRGQIRGMRLSAVMSFHRFAMQSGWIFLGVSSTELLVRFYAFVVAGWFGPRALASLSATQQMLRPVALLAASWSMVARADLARRREAADWRGFARVLILAGLGGAVVALVWTLLVFAGWGLISRHLFGGKYATNGWMVLVWGAAAGVAFAQVVASSGLQTLHVFKALALANTAATLAAAGAILVLMARMGYAGAIFGTALGQVVELLIMGVMLAVLLRARLKEGPGLGRGPVGGVSSLGAQP